MTHCVERTINMTPLPSEQRRDSLREAYEHLEPGETMQAIDDFNPEWVRNFLEECFHVTLAGENFVIEENAGRFVVYVQKPESNGNASSTDRDRPAEVFAE